MVVLPDHRPIEILAGLANGAGSHQRAAAQRPLASQRLVSTMLRVLQARPINIREIGVQRRDKR
jgi:hypothetical protein